MNIKKTNIVFVGSFKRKSKAGGVGGQMYACQSLIKSPISEKVNWILVDSTAESNLNIPFQKRLIKSCKRLISFLKILFTKKVDIFLIFSSNGFSFTEKGFMAFLASFRHNSRVIFAPRSGRILVDIRKRKAFVKFILNRCDKIICQGPSWKETFAKELSISESKLITVVNWLDTSKYSPSNSKNDRVTLLFMGWLEKDKGIFDLINAVKSIKDLNRSFVLKIAGKGKHELEAKELVNKLGLQKHVVFLGWVLAEDKIDLLSTSDIFVLPSYFEGSPNALLEAMSSGLACVSTTVGSIPDILAEDRGILVAPGDTKALKSSLLKLIDNVEVRENLANNGLSYVRNEHDVSKSIERFSSLFNLK
jgi:glycosyltransferase involved in cell wall biosynthesis